MAKIHDMETPCKKCSKQTLKLVDVPWYSFVYCQYCTTKYSTEEFTDWFQKRDLPNHSPEYCSEILKQK